MTFADKIFREYDIRGVFGEDYTPDFANVLAHVLADRLRANVKPAGQRLRFAIGRDARPSGEDLARRFRNTLLEQGIDVLDLGIVPTPLVYFSTIHFSPDAAISITGSHNPSEYNGFKICIGTPTLHGKQIQELKTACKELAANPPKASFFAPGTLTSTDAVSAYLADVRARISVSRKLTVVVDAGNGTGGIVGPKLLELLGCNVIPIHCELDGRFPNHHPDPTVLENLRDLQKAVREHGADVGIAYDGDADRIGVVDETGRPIYGDELMVLFSREILARKPGAKIISEVKCSTRLYQDITKRGGRPIMWKTGHSLIKAKMKEEKAELAGEMSGHMFFADRYYGYDDAIYASARLLEILGSARQPLSQLLSDLPTCVSTPELRVDCPDEIKFEVIRRASEILSGRFATIQIDGVRIETTDGWGLIRASNTQPAVVMRFEAQTPERLKELQLTVESAFEAAKRAVKSRR